jgi:hypothetical protein
MTQPTRLYAFFAVPALWLMLASLAHSADTITVTSPPTQTAVIELYTSEGCSSCPAADQWLEQLIQLPPEDLNVLALAFHVDYWDYIGWKDRFASPAYSNRQRHLARVNQQNSVYTPEFFVDGVETRGTRRIIENARKANQQKSSVDLELTIRQDENILQLDLSSHFNPDQHPAVRFVVFEDKLESDVDNGENAGLQLRHERVVRYFSNPQPLKAGVMHQIKLDPQWQRQHLGVGALVISDQGEYLQAVYSLLGGHKP